jgi:hypothetical protein
MNLCHRVKNQHHKHKNNPTSITKTKTQFTNEPLERGSAEYQSIPQGSNFVLVSTIQIKDKAQRKFEAILTE